MTLEKVADAGAVDGRRQRSERSRQAIIDAALALMESGNLVPTAQQIVDCADVGLRSFFRHFEDMETLFQAIDDNIRGQYLALFQGGDRQGSLEERIQHAAERHAEAYERVEKIVLSTTAQRWRYEILRKTYARNQHKLRKDLEDWLPELTSLPDHRRESVDAIASFEMWHRLREHQGLSKKAALGIVTELLKSLIIQR